MRSIMMHANLLMALVYPSRVIREYVPWTLECFRQPSRVTGRRFALRELTGAGKELRSEPSVASELC